MKSAPLRWLGALGLAVSFALPQTSCSGYYSPDGEFVRNVPAVADSSAYTPGVDWGYVIEEMAIGDPPSWGWPLVFAWPLGLLLILRGRSVSGRRSWRVLLELPAIVATGMLLFGLIVLEHQAWGNVVAFVSLGLFTGGWLLDVTEWVRGMIDPATRLT